MMAITEYLNVVLVALLFMLFNLMVYIVMKSPTKSSSRATPTNWPIVGALPALLRNTRRTNDFVADVLRENGGTFFFKGPVFGGMDMMITADPANFHHVLSKNFPNYPKGPEFRRIFEVMGDGIFNVDDNLWDFHRKTTMSFLSNPQFHSLLQTNVWNKAKKSLLPVLDHFAKKEAQFDLQDIFLRFTFDSISMLLLHEDPESLSVDLPDLPTEKAFHHMASAFFYRHVLPESVWRLQKWLRIGKEKLLQESYNALEEFISSSIKRLEQQLSDNNNKSELSFYSVYKKASEQEGTLTKKTGSELMAFIKDTYMNLVFAGRDTTSATLTWLFCLLAQNPLALEKTRDEIDNKLNLKENMFFKVEECRNLVYLHGAICETLRLYPPVPLNHKISASAEVLPSGHWVKPNKRMILSFYAAGRMPSIWGEDCMEFKPERWVSTKGGIKHEPSYKFPAFNAGPRTCLGKDMSLIQMKMIAACLLHRYDFELVDPDSLTIVASTNSQLKYGLKVRFSLRNTA